MNPHRLNDFIIGFAICLGFFLLLGLSNVSNRYNDESSIMSEFQNIYMNFQSKQFDVLTSTPVYQDLQEGQIIIVNSNGVKNLITRFSTDTYRILWIKN